MVAVVGTLGLPKHCLTRVGRPVESESLEVAFQSLTNKAAGGFVDAEPRTYPIVAARLARQHNRLSVDFAGRCLGGIRLAARQADLGPFASSGNQRRTRYASPRKGCTSQLCAESALKEPIVHITVSQPWRQPVGGRRAQSGLATAWVPRRCQVAARNQGPKPAKSREEGR